MHQAPVFEPTWIVILALVVVAVGFFFLASKGKKVIAKASLIVLCTFGGLLFAASSLKQMSFRSASGLFTVERPRLDEIRNAKRTLRRESKTYASPK